MSVAGEPQVENVPRGLLLSLVTIPAGIAAWLILWNFGFIASIVAWGIAFLASWLYRVGAGRITRPGVIVIAGVTVVTLVLALFAGFAWDVAAAFDSQYGIAWSKAMRATTKARPRQNIDCRASAGTSSSQRHVNGSPVISTIGISTDSE